MNTYPVDLLNIINGYLSCKEDNKIKYDIVIKHLNRNMKFVDKYVLMRCFDVYRCKIPASQYILLASKTKHIDTSIYNGYHPDHEYGLLNIDLYDVYNYHHTVPYYLPEKRLIYGN